MTENNILIKKWESEPEGIYLITSDEEYIRLRFERNLERDRIEYEGDWSFGSIKKLDKSLELYERLKGTDYCQKIWIDYIS